MSYSAVDAYCDICAEIDKGPANGDFDHEGETEANRRVVEAFYARQQAARAMLAALRKVATCQTSHESAKRPPDFYEAAFNIFVADARAAIAQAEAVGIKAE